MVRGYLEQYSGGQWKAVASWVISKTGTVDITKTYTGISNGRYRTKPNGGSASWAAGQYYAAL